MGWQDAPLVEDEAPDTGQSAWMSAPEVDAPDEAQAPPAPSMGAVALNAAGKGVSDAWKNAYETAANTFLGQVITHGLKAVSGNSSVTERPNVERMAEQAGIVNSENNPQTGPQRIVEAAIRAAVNASVIPSSGPAGVVKAGVAGLVSGGVGKSVEELAKPILGETASHWLGVATGAIIPLVPLAPAAFRALKPTPQSPLNTKTRIETLRAAQAEGFVVEPDSVKPSALNKTLAGVAGGGKLKIESALRNQRAATELAKRELGLPHDAELNSDMFKALKDTAGAPYKELKQLPGGAQLLEQVQQKRSDAAALWRSYGNTDKPPPDLRNLAMAADREVKQLESSIDRLAQQSGVPGLLDRVVGAREAFAKIYDVESVTNIGDGHVSLPALGSMADAGRPLSGKLLVAAKFQQAFKPVAREGSSLGTVASGTDAASAAHLGTIAASGGGGVWSTLAGTVPFARNMARNKALSPSTQRSLLDMDTSLVKLSMRPNAVRGMSRSALIGNSLADLSKGNDQ